MQRLFFAFIVLTPLLFSCTRELDDVQWDTEVLAPLAKTSISIQQLTQEDSLFYVDGDNQVSVVISEEVYAFERPLDSLISLSVQPFTNTVTLQSLVLSPPEVTQSIRMEELIQPIIDNSVITSIPDGACIPNFFFALIPPITMDDQVVDVTDFFEDAVLQTGTLNVSLNNGFPVTLDSAILEIRNSVGGQVLYQETVTNVEPGDSAFYSEDIAAALAGQPIEGNLTISISNIVISPPADTTCALINYDDEISVSMSLVDLQVEEATAIFPAQNVVDTWDTVGFTDMEDVELTRIIIDSAKVAVQVTSTIPTKMFFSYIIPPATLNGDTFRFDAEVPPAPEGGTIVYDEVYPFEGYELDLTGPDGSFTNTFWNTLVGRIDSTGELINLTLSDTISIKLQILQLTARYAEGYLGQEFVTIGPDTVDLDAFDFIQGGDLSFEDVNLTFSIENGLGIDANVEITDLATSNTSTSQTESLNPTPAPFDIAAAVNLGTSAQPTTTTLDIDGATDMLNILPDKAIYTFDVSINPDGNTPPYSDFVYNESGFKANLDIELPLSMQATDLLLRDTVALDFGTTENIDEISGGTLKLVVDNGFPMDAQVALYMINQSGDIIDSLTSNDIIAAGAVDNDGKVTSSSRSVVLFPVATSSIDNLLQSSELVIDVTFNTQPQSTFVRIYDDYTLDVSVIGDFEYSAKVKL